MTLHLPRRRLLTGLASLLAAPAIVRASSLMPVVPVRPVAFSWRGVPLLTQPSDGLVLYGHDVAKFSNAGVSLEFALERATQGGFADIRTLGVSLTRNLPVAGHRKTDEG